MLKPEDMNIALESIEEENEIDLDQMNDEEKDESNDAIDESVPDEGGENKDESEDKSKEEGGDTDTATEEGSDPAGDSGAEEGGEKPTEGASEEPGVDDPEAAKQELLDETPMPDTEPAEQSVEIKDADDSDANASPKEVALDMEEVGSLEQMLDVLENDNAPMSVLSRVGNLYSNILRMSHGLEAFGLDGEFRVQNKEDVTALKTALKTAIEKHKQ